MVSIQSKYPLNIMKKNMGHFEKWNIDKYPLGILGKKMTQNILKSVNILFFGNVAHDFMLCKCTFKYTINFFGMFSPFEK
jgi:hypothetical protein